MGLEGIVSKRIDAPYRSGLSKTWVKSKNPRLMRCAGNVRRASPSSPDHSRRFGASSIVLDANAHAKAMIDAVTSYQPSPLDSEYSSEKPATLKQKLGEKRTKTHRIENE